MIKPKYPKLADISQIARIVAEHATGECLTLPRTGNVNKPSQKQGRKKDGKY